LRKGGEQGPERLSRGFATRAGATVSPPASTSPARWCWRGTRFATIWPGSGRCGDNSRSATKKAPRRRHMTQRRPLARPRSDLRSMTLIDDPRIANGQCRALRRRAAI